MTLVTSKFIDTERFEIVRELGQGGMGVVFEAYDRELGTTCALKLLPHATPRTLLLFKQEFRALQGLSHPNLIALGELFSEGEHWFFTMELVHGVDLLTYVRPGASGGERRGTEALQQPTVTLEDSAPSLRAPPGPPSHRGRTFDEARLRASLHQLAEGLRFLHDAGKVHRDVKPSNVIVTASGRVVILDFGLVADHAGPDRRGGKAAFVSSALGTPAYMAPEHAFDGPIGPPADLYAMGVVLFRALTGIFPFADFTVEGLRLRKLLPTPRPSQLVATVPRVLDDLCARLLEPDPTKRPQAREVLACLGASTDPPPAPEPSRVFVGRREELATIRSAYEESARRPVLVALEGPSGIGKTALLAEILAELGARQDDPLILAGRCYEHEGIPYKAIDGVMDELGEHLAHDLTDIDVPTNAPLLGVLFPVLRRAPGFTPSKSSRAMEVGEAVDAHEMRRGAERVARALLARIAARRPLILAIDDFQWTDADSVTFLTALACPPEAPPFLLVLSSRTEVAPLFRDAFRRITLTPLPADDARSLAATLLARAGADAAHSADVIAREAGGNPFFMNELVLSPALETEAQAGPHARLEDVLWSRISGCGAAARDVLELAAVAAAPILQSLVAEAAGMDAASFTRAAHELRAARLVRTTGVRSSDAIEAYHDRIRETVVARLTSAARTARHLDLARAIERRRPDDLDALVTHFEGGGDGARAASYAVRAGDRAAAALAFERAAAFYRRAIERLPPAACRAEQLHLKLADALANAGMGADAAVAYELAAQSSEPTLALELRRRATEHLLLSGRLDEGLASLAAILAEVRVRMPRTPVMAFASLLFHRARVRLRGLSFTERQEAEIPAADLVRVDTLWGAGARLGAIDPIAAADFQTRYLLGSLDLGEPFRIARALVTEAVFVSTAGPRERPRVEELLTRARSLAARVEHPYATAMLQFAEGLSNYEFGHYRSGLTGLDRAAELLRTTCTGGSHEIAVANRFAIDCLFNLGELDEMRRRVPRLLEDAERRGDFYLAAELRTGIPNLVWLASDQPDEARRSTDLGIASWSRKGFYLQHYYHALATAHIALYLGDGERAHRTVEDAWPGLQRSLLLKVQAVRPEAFYLRARAAIAAGGRAAMAVAEKMIAALAREPVPAAPGFAAAARAGLSARRGDVASAAAHLCVAERGFASADVGLYAAACRVHLGRLDRGASAAETIAKAEAVMRARGVVRPDRFADLLIPGIRGVTVGERSD